MNLHELPQGVQLDILWDSIRTFFNARRIGDVKTQDAAERVFRAYLTDGVVDEHDVFTVEGK